MYIVTAVVLLCRAHRHRWWLKVSTESRPIALLPTSPMEQAGGTVEMEGEVVFRRDAKSNLTKAVSGTEWMYQRGALERGSQVSVGIYVGGCWEHYGYFLEILIVSTFN